MIRRTRIHRRLAVVVAIGAATAAAAAAKSGPTLHVFGPTKPKVGETVVIGAKGKTPKQRKLVFDIHLNGKCGATYGADTKAGGSNVFTQKVGPGKYYQAAQGGFGQPGSGHYCAYLYKKGFKASDKPVLKASQSFVVQAPPGVPTQVGYQHGQPYYHGKLESPKAACLNGRTVTLYGKQSGKPDRAESHGTSKADGSWYVPLPLDDTSGDTAIYFAVSPAKPQGAGFTCRGDRTPDIAIGGN